MRNCIDTQDRPPFIIVRVPGSWPNRSRLRHHLPRGVRLDGEALVLPGGYRMALQARPCDDAFVRVFLDSRNGAAGARERARIEGAGVLACLVAPGGSLDAVHRAGEAVTALLLAGGHGTFVDNSGATCAREDWLDMHDGTADAIVATLLSRVHGEAEVFSMGMHMAGLRDAVLDRGANLGRDLIDLTMFLLYAFDPASPIVVGDLVGDANGPQFRVRKEQVTFPPPGHPMHNPYGRWRLQRWDAEG